MLIEGAAEERVELVLSTTDPSLASVHPQNPASTSEVREADDIQLFAVKFTQDPKPVKRAAGRVAPKAF